MQKYYNPRLHNAVVAGTGMEHPRRPHVVLGSELNGYVQGDLVDANGICDLIHEKNVDTYAKLEALETSLKNESKARVNSIDNLSEQIDRTIANKLGSTETVYGESIQRAAEDERLQLQINELNSKYTALWNSLSALNTTVNGKQDTLVAGNNIKNISDGTNTVSLLGAGDVRFKTINGQSILGNEDITVAAGGGGSTVIRINPNTTFAEIQAAIQAAPDKENVYITEYPDPQVALMSRLPHFTIAKLNTISSSDFILFENENVFVVAYPQTEEEDSGWFVLVKNERYKVEPGTNGNSIVDTMFNERISTEEYASLHTITNVISYNGVYYYLHSVHPNYAVYTSEKDKTIKSVLRGSGSSISNANIISIYKRLDAPTELDAYSDSVSRPGLLTHTGTTTYSKVSVDEIYITDNGVYFDTQLGGRAISLDNVNTMGDVRDAVISVSNGRIPSHADQEFTPFSYGLIQDLYLVRKGETDVIFASKHGNAMIYIKADSSSIDSPVTVYNLTKDYRYIINQYSENNLTYTTVRDLFTNTRLDPKEVHLYTDTIADSFMNGRGRIYKLVSMDPDVILGEWDGNYPKVISSYAGSTYPSTIDIGAVSSPTSE